MRCPFRLKGFVCIQTKTEERRTLEGEREFERLGGGCIKDPYSVVVGKQES